MGSKLASETRVGEGRKRQRRCHSAESPRTARFVEDETPNARWNPNRNPEWWGDFSQLVEIEKIKFLCISRYRFKLRF